MEELRRAAVITAAVAVAAAVLIGWVVVTPATVGPTPGRTIVASGNGTFSLSQGLPTSSVSSSNPKGCGANVSENLLLEGFGETLDFNLTVNASGALVHYSLISGSLGPFINGTLNSSAPIYDEVHSDNNTVNLEFVFQGCAPFSVVPLGFWGAYHSFYLIEGL